VIPRDLLVASRETLARRLAAGHRFEASELAGLVYRGVSLGLPGWVDRLLWKKFAKAFDRGARGWNIRIEDDGLDAPWRPKLERGRPVTFGHFRVVGAAGRVELDYGGIRDPLVALDPGSAELLLGRSEIALGGLRVGTPSYFVLQRGGPLEAASW
jgi:hypothetical protein